MKEGPQPPACALQECDAPPANGMVGYCVRHLTLYSATAPVVEPDNPALIEAEAKRAAELEAAEYAERRRVKTWRTLENGSRTPETYYTDAELADIDAEAEADAAALAARLTGTAMPATDEFRFASKVATPSHTWEFDPKTGEHIPDDPTKAAAKVFRKALRGRYGPAAQKMAWAFIEQLS